MIFILGDNHGCFDHIAPAIVAERAAGHEVEAVIFLGDIEAQRDFGLQIAPIEALGVEVFWIVGNHDTDTEENWRHLQNSQHRRIDGKVVEIAGLRIAGLGGVFRGAIWFPRDSKNAGAVEEPRFDSYADFAADLHQKQGLKRRLSKLDKIRAEAVPDRIAKLMDTTKNGQLRKHCSTIFPETVRKLASQRADILLTHEAPGCHPHGFDELTRLAQSMRVKASFHGHQHDNLDYSAHYAALGFRPYGVGFCGITALDPETLDVRVVVPGDFDVHRQYRQQKVEEK